MGRITMFEQNNFDSREQLDLTLAQKVSEILQQAILQKGKASLAVSGGSTPTGFFKELSNKDIEWNKVTITLADERWVDIHSEDSNTRLVHENLLQNKASEAKFFYLKQGAHLSDEILADLNVSANNILLPLDVLILGMGEDGHTASIFPCSAQIKQALDINNENALMMVEPTTAPHQRITFCFSSLSQSKNIFLHLCGNNKKQVLDKALNGDDIFDMPIRKFLQTDNIDTQIYWAV